MSGSSKSCGLSMGSPHLRVRRLILGNNISSDQVQQIGNMGEGCYATLDSDRFPASALGPVSTVTFSESTAPTQTAVLLQEQSSGLTPGDQSQRGVST